MSNVRPPTSVRLMSGFRFAHEPLATNQATRFVGRAYELQALAERVFFSTGGSFLITGYRGVGKTSFVNNVIARVRTIAESVIPSLGVVQVVDVYLSIARPLSAAELMHHIVRHLYDRLIDLGIFDSLPLHVRDAIVLAHRRTSESITNKFGETVGREYGSETGIAGPLLAALAKFSMKRTESRSSNHEFSFLEYDDKAAESDVLRIARYLTNGFEVSLSPLERFVFKLLGRRIPRIPVKAIFVFDELDKLDEETGDAATKPFLDQLLGDLKNLFTTS